MYRWVHAINSNTRVDIIAEIMWIFLKISNFPAAYNCKRKRIFRTCGAQGLDSLPPMCLLTQGSG